MVNHPTVPPLNGEFRMTLDLGIHCVLNIVISAFLCREIGEDDTNTDMRMLFLELLQATVNYAVELSLVANKESI